MIQNPDEITGCNKMEVLLFRIWLPLCALNRRRGYWHRFSIEFHLWLLLRYQVEEMRERN